MVMYGAQIILVFSFEKVNLKKIFLTLFLEQRGEGGGSELPTSGPLEKGNLKAYFFLLIK